MHEIKFRAWDKNSKKMFEVDELIWCPEKNDNRIAVRTSDLSKGFVNIWNEFELMQYIGIRDKNEREIYEGDIVEWDEGIGVIFWDEKEARYLHTYREKIDPECFRPSKAFWNIIEVVGNIYETPVL